MRKCFGDNGWSDSQIQKIFGKPSEEVSAEDLADAMKMLGDRRNNTYRQAAAIEQGAAVMARGESGRSGLMSLLSRDVTERSGYVSVDNRINTIRSVAHSKMDMMMNGLAPTLKQTLAGIATGTRKLSPEQQKLSGNMVRELFGEQTGHADAQKAAKSWKKATGDLNDRFGRAGGNIRELDDWRLPQRHDRVRVAETTADEWVDKVLGLVDQEKMIGKLHSASKDIEGLREALHSAHRNIVSGGISLKEMENRKMADMMQNERFITFRDADSWLKYQQEFGEPNIYASMLSHIDGMSRNIGLMETFGPDPREGYEALATVARNRDGKNTHRADRTYDLIAGNNMVDGPKIGDLLANVRNIRVASKLGSAVVSAVSDTVYSKMALKYNGMPSTTIARKIFNAELLKFGEDTKSRKAWARDFGLTAEYALDRAMMSHDYQQNYGSLRTRNTAEAVMRMSGMNQWTESARATFLMEMTQGFTKAADLDFIALPHKMRRALERYGIDGGDWADMRKYKTNHEGMMLIDGTKMPEDLQTKWVGMMDSEMNMGVPTPNAQVRSKMTFGSKSGSAGGELIRSMMQFQSFNVTQIMQQWGRVVRGQGDMSDKMAGAAGMLGLMTLMGGLLIQVKEVLNGKTPLDPSTPEFAARAFAQGGGAPFLGDFIAKEAMGWRNETTGIVGGAPLDYADFFINLAGARSHGDAEKAAKIMAEFTTREMPFQNLWYTKLATDRLLMDRIRRMADPKYDEKMLRRMRKMEDQGQDYWWRPPVAETNLVGN